MSESFPSDPSQGKIVVFGARQIRRAWHNNQWYFSVVDMVGALTDSPNPRNYWSMMKAREQQGSGVELSTFCVQLKLTSSDGKSYKTAAHEGGSVAGSARRHRAIPCSIRDPTDRAAEVLSTRSMFFVNQIPGFLASLVSWRFNAQNLPLRAGAKRTHHTPDD